MLGVEGVLLGSAACAVVAVLAYHEGKKRGVDAVAPGLRAALAATTKAAEEAHETRYLAGYEQGYADRGLEETAKRSAAGLKAAAKRRAVKDGVTLEPPPVDVPADTVVGTLPHGRPA